MTTVNITISEPRYTIILDGHATGSAEVCSGISALVYALADFLENNEDKIFLKSINLDHAGWGYIMFELEDPSPKMKGAFELVMIGLLQIAKAYPDFCKVDVKDVTEKNF